MFSEIEQVIKALNPQTISTERKAILQPLTEFIQSKVSNQQDIRINFVLDPIILEYYSTFHNNLLCNFFIPHNEVFILVPFFHRSNLS